MRIEKLKTAPDRAGRYYIQFDNGTVLRPYRQTMEDFGIYPGQEFTEEEFRRLKEADGKMSAKMRAVRIISATSISRKDLEKRLVQKGENPGQAKDAVQWLEDLRLVDDRNTAEQIVHSCISKGYGLSRAKQALFEKRIPREYWEEALADYPDQQERILSFLKSRLDADSDEKEIKRAVDALIRRGHSYSSIREGLNQLRLETEDFLEEE